MPSSNRRSPFVNADTQELEAQRVACSYLVKGCERALFDFGLIAGEKASADAARIDERAIEIMRAVVGSWRETLSLLNGGYATPEFGYGPWERAFLGEEAGKVSEGSATF